MTDIHNEQEKWDQIYSSTGLDAEGESLRSFNNEFADLVLQLLPDGGKTIEVGSGGGWQSLALARTGKFEVSLLDFSSEALNYSKRIFERENLQANFILGDAFDQSTPEYDLVFNAGVLEHYPLQEQANLLRAMASRSQKYVLTLVPNRENYWYWLWRIQAAGEEAWPYGKETPEISLREAYKLAGINYVGHKHLAISWTESMINSIKGLSEDLRNLILLVHRSKVVPSTQTGYLIAELGCVNDTINESPSKWGTFTNTESELFSSYYSILADALSASIQGNFRATIAEKELTETRNKLISQNDKYALLEQTIKESQDKLTSKENQIYQIQQEIKNTKTTADNQMAIIRKEFESKLIDRDIQISSLQEALNKNQLTLNEIYQSRGWKLVKVFWKIRTVILPNHGWIMKFLRRLKKKYREIINLHGRIRRREFRLLPVPMSWEAYSFDTYKRERLSKHKSDFSQLYVPSKTGLVSLILPVHNGEKYLSEAIESILNQTYTNFELIAINDGSTDNSAKILDDFAKKDKRIKVIHQENQKLPATLSRGIRLAIGEYITWTSDDNRLKPRFIEAMVDCLHRHPSWDMVYGNEDIIGDDGQPLVNSDWYPGYQQPAGSNHIYLPSDPSVLNIYPNNYIGGAFMYRSRVAWLLGDYSKIRFTTEDYDYWMQVNSLMTLRHTDFSEPLYEYRFHSKSLTHRDEELKITHNRVFLMAFDSFRRDFYLSQMIWILKTENVTSHNRTKINKILQDYIERHDHINFQPASIDSKDLPRLWNPVIHLEIVDNAAPNLEPPADLPKNTFKVLLSLSDDVLPAKMDFQWDLCLAVGARRGGPKLNTAYSGWITSNDIEVLFDAIDVRARCEHLRLIENEIAEPPLAQVKASIIVCTFRRGEKLRDTLISLAQQTLPIDDFEVIVVNNDPQDTKVKVIVDELRQTAFSPALQKFRLIYAPIAGLSYARNAGIAEAIGKIVCFIDDDAVAEADWLEQIITGFDNHPNTGAIGGYISLDPPSPKPKVLQPGLENLWSQFILPFTDYHECEGPWEYPFGANWCAQRNAMVEIGGFRTRYGRKHQNFGGGEETIASSLLRSIRYNVGLLPQARVHHRVDKSRYSRKHVIKTQRSMYFTEYQMRKDFYIPIGKPIGVNLFYLVEALKSLVAKPIKRRTNRPGWALIAEISQRSSLLFSQFEDILNRFGKTIIKQHNNHRLKINITNNTLDLAVYVKDHGQTIDQLRKTIKHKGTIIFLPSICWDIPLFQRPQQLAGAFANLGYLVFYCEPAYSKCPPGVFKLSERLYDCMVDLRSFKNVEKPISIVFSYNLGSLRFLRSPQIVYEYIDELSIFPGNYEDNVHNHQFLLKSAKVVVATAQSLYEQVIEHRPDALLCPNGVNYNHFTSGKESSNTTVPEDLQPILAQGGPIISYYGALAPWFDYALVSEIARMRPNWNIVLIGPEYENRHDLLESRILALPNIFWLGAKDYSLLPNYIWHFDVMMIPFVLSDLTHSTSPLKLFEYMASGKPVVVTPMRECMRYPGVLSASNSTEFTERIEDALRLRNDPKYLQIIDQVARENTWDQRVQQILQAVNSDNNDNFDGQKK